jgi:hypothetical protein
MRRSTAAALSERGYILATARRLGGRQYARMAIERALLERG